MAAIVGAAADICSIKPATLRLVVGSAVGGAPPSGVTTQLPEVASPLAQVSVS